MNRLSPPMKSAVLRLSGSDAALDEIVRKLNLEVLIRQKSGERGYRGRVHDASGLNASIAEAARPAAMFAELRQFLDTCLAHGPSLFSGLDAQVSLGVTVGADDQFVPSVVLSAADLRAFATLCLSLNFTGYSESDSESPPESGRS